MKSSPGMSGKQEQFDMLYTSGALSEADYLGFSQSTDWGPKHLDITKITDAPTLDRYLSWSVAMSYVSNFVYTFEDYSCDGYEVEPFFGWATAPSGVKANEALVAMNGLKFWDMEWESFEHEADCGMHKHTAPCGPVQVMLTSYFGQEIVTVTARDVLVCQVRGS